MSYDSQNLLLTEALALMASRCIDDPKGQLLRALMDGVVTASGTADGTRKMLPCVWWFHNNSPLDMDTVWFDRRNTNPPTPFRAERIEVPKAQIDELWPESTSTIASGVSPAGLPKATAPALEKWAGDRWPDGKLPGRDELLIEARKVFSSVKEHKHIRPLRNKLATEENKKGGAPAHRGGPLR